MDHNDPVLEARERKASGQRLQEWRADPRMYFCRGCGKKAEGTHVPRSWYILTRSSGGSTKAHRLGLFCSAVCLDFQLPRFQGIEEKLGDHWDTVPTTCET